MYVQQMRAARLEEMKKQESSNLKAAQQVQMELNEDELLLRPPPDDSHRVDSMHSTASTALSFSRSSRSASGPSVAHASRGERKRLWNNDDMLKENACNKDNVEVLDSVTDLFTKSNQAIASILGSIQNNTMPAVPAAMSSPIISFAPSPKRKHTKLDHINNAITSLQEAQARALANEDTIVHDQISMQLQELHDKKFDLIMQDFHKDGSSSPDSHV
jgi:hypothetical protein